MNIENITDIPISSDFEQILDCFSIADGEQLLELGCGPFKSHSHARRPVS